MDIGMLWYDGDSKRQLNEKILRAVDYYRQKYGARPNVCYVNPALLVEGQAQPSGVQLRPARTVLRDHFWLGVSEN